MPVESTARTCLTLKARQLDALRELSRSTGAPMAELARRAVDSFLSDRIPGYIPGHRYSEPASYATMPLPSTNRS